MVNQARYSILAMCRQFRCTCCKIKEICEHIRRDDNLPLEEDFPQVVLEDPLVLVGEVAHVLPPGELRAWV